MPLLRIDMPGLCFDDLDLHFDHRNGHLSYQPDALEDLMLWNGLRRDTDLADLEYSLADPTAPLHQDLHDFLSVCYAYWLVCGGACNGAMEASLTSPLPVRLARQAPLHQTALQRLSRALQSWLGLLDIYDDPLAA